MKSRVAYSLYGEICTRNYGGARQNTVIQCYLVVFLDIGNCGHAGSNFRRFHFHVVMVLCSRNNWCGRKNTVAIVGPLAALDLDG